MKIIPTIHLSGHCKEAYELYKKAFDAEVSFSMTYQDAVNKGWEKDIQKNN